MAKNTSSSKDAFNKAADPDQIDDQRTIADTNNNGPKHTPKDVQTFQPHLSPSGSVPIQSSSSDNNQEPPKDEWEIEFIPEEPKKQPMNLSTDDLTLDWEDSGYRILVKQEDFPHKDGIDGGRITRLAMTNDEGTQVYFGNGEWTEKPDLPIECELVDNIKEDLNHAPEPEKTAEPSKSKDHDFDI